MDRIYIPFNKRIVLVGGEYSAKDSIKSAMKNFRFSPDPGELEAEYRKMLQMSDHSGFGCTSYESIKANAQNKCIWEADWIAGGSLNPNLYTEKIDGYYVRGGRMTSMYINTEYYGFMVGTGEWLFDTEDLFGTEEEYRYLITRKYQTEYETYKAVSDIFMDRLHKAYESATATDYIALDDILL
jgi:hypothetical protein